MAVIVVSRELGSSGAHLLVTRVWKHSKFGDFSTIVTFLTLPNMFC